VLVLVVAVVVAVVCETMTTRMTMMRQKRNVTGWMKMTRKKKRMMRRTRMTEGSGWQTHAMPL
jgi:hypothetical protein